MHIRAATASIDTSNRFPIASAGHNTDAGEDAVSFVDSNTEVFIARHRAPAHERGVVGISGIPRRILAYRVPV